MLEGLHALKHALRFGATILDVRTRDRDALRDLAADLAPDVADRLLTLAQPTDADLFHRLTPAPHPTGVVGLARRPQLELGAVLAGAASERQGGGGDGPIVLLERPTHHGNIGAVVRVAAAAGAAAVLVTGPHDPWHPSSIRGGAGLQFALPVMGLDREGVETVLTSDRPVVALDPEGEPLEPGGPAVPPGALLVFGSERRGISEPLLQRADTRISIPMRPGVSSLNLATAVSVVLYLTRRPTSVLPRSPRSAPAPSPRPPTGP